jgi:glutaconate CoA-transferase, subunit A
MSLYGACRGLRKVDDRPKRKSVIASEEAAVSRIQPGMTIALGGFSVTNHPMPLVRQIIKKGIKHLTVVGAATAGLDIDLLIAAGCVDKLIAPYVGGESYAPIGHAFRFAVEHGNLELWECSEFILYARLQAQAMGQGFMACRCGLGSSIPDLNPDLKEFKDPIHGETYLAVPALEVDWAILHVGVADQYGNGQHLGSCFGDRLMAQASNRVILVTEQVVPNAVIRRNPYRTSVPYADVVVEARFASHPFAGHGCYAEDARGIEEYVTATAALRKGNRDPFNAYLEKYIYGPRDHYEYLQLIGLERLFALQKAYADLPGYRLGE